ncbi:DnaJ-domain-containing protein [Lophiostoma macrostomum CBS 122681]|uniref:DnaJ-domain-containing protein n=1 Tax=Lophiostoma macrostomum CBS 122681 TaxID=1314788 RepID=A0A6A6SM99_9PLEO|nr:DnaJ-domain-containing protein [Lophiostoma macrostomum CBS 122681]
MGAGQSSGANGGAGGANGEVKTSYYELLGVERSATDDEIKKAYRRKALELHPDRNYNDVERTTALFAEVQTAYEILSDPQERAWYDAHEGDILRGGSGEGDAAEFYYKGNTQVTTADDVTRILGNFRRDVPYTDAPTGFFGFLKETFEQLAKEEEQAAGWDGLQVPEYPTFGHKDDTYEDVVRDFYGGWSGFATRKNYAWKDRYRLSEAPDRRIRRMMEKENKRFREEGIREFNDAVRTLVLFVRKRDPRYTPNTQSADQRAKAQRAATKEQAAKARAARLKQQMEEAVPAWATRRDPDEVEEEEEEDEVEHVFECVACNKTFKSDRQYEAHEKSKKHQKAAQALRRKMEKENARLHLDDDAISSGIMTPPSDQEGDVVDAGTASDHDVEMEDVADDIANLNLTDASANKGMDEETQSTSEPSTESHWKLPPASPSGSDDSSGDDEYASRSDIEARLSAFTQHAPATSNPSSKAEPLNTDLSTPDATIPVDTDSAPESSTPKLGKAAQKKAKRAAKEAALKEAGLEHQCSTCKAVFPSKNKLHEHLKDEHSIGAAKGKGGKKGKKNRPPVGTSDT